MSDAFSNFSPPPIMHHSYQSQPPAYMHSPLQTSPHLPYPQVTSPHLPHPQVTSPHLSHAQVTSPHLSHPQVTSPHLSHSQVTSPHLPHPQVTSPHLSHTQVTSPHLPHAQVTSPHLSHPQVTSPHLSHAQVTSPHLPHPQVTSPHLSHTQVTSPHLPHSQVTSPHLSHTQVTSPHLPHPHHPHPQVASPHLSHPQVSSAYLPPYQVTSPHLSAPQVNSLQRARPQGTSLHLVHQSLETSFDFPHSEVTPPQIPPLPQDLLFGSNPCSDFNHPDWDGAGLTCLLNGGEGLSFQNQTSLLLDEGAPSPYDTHIHFEHFAPGHAQNTWGALELTQPQLRGSPLGSGSEGVPLGGWSSMEDLPDIQFFNDAPQPFYSPTTPGPSPHYPSTSALLSPAGPPRADGPVFHSQQTFSYSPMESHQQLLQHQTSPFPVHPEPSRRPPGLLGPAGPPEDDFSRQGRDVGLNQGDESRGGAAPDSSWMKLVKPENITEVLDSRLLCLVCKRDFRSLPALNGHMRSHRGSWLKKDLATSNTSAASVVMPVTVPVQSRGTSRTWRRGQKRGGTTGGGALYRSLMQLDGAEGEDEEERGRLGGDGGHYTPPLMLPPLRAGSGLFCTLTTRRRRRVQTVKLHNGFRDVAAAAAAAPPPGTLTTRLLKPRMNVGPGFQANIPPLRPKRQACFDSHNALLLWTPWAELEQPATQQRVEALLRMVRSSVVAGGGASPDYTLHVLSECKGDFLLTTEKLLSSNGPSGVCWSAAEKRLLVKSLQLHQKNFSVVQKAVKTKTLSECVEFYYLCKRKMNLSVNTSTSLTVSLPDGNGQSSSGSRDVKIPAERHTTSQRTQKCRSTD